jgi:hypothetical protein
MGRELGRDRKISAARQPVSRTRHLRLVVALRSWARGTTVSITAIPWTFTNQSGQMHALVHKAVLPM